MRFTLIIATCDRPGRLAKCLDAVAVAIRTHGEADRIIVVDNGGGEGKEARGKREEREGVEQKSAHASSRLPLRGRDYAGQAKEAKGRVPVLLAAGLGRGESEEQIVNSERSEVGGRKSAEKHPDVRGPNVDSPSTTHHSPLASPPVPPSPCLSCEESLRVSVHSVVDAFAARSGIPVKYLRTTPRNKAKALNAGIAVADTEWLAFTDDDCLPDANWLEEAARFAGEHHYEAFGGQIVCAVPNEPVLRHLRPGLSKRIPGGGVFVYYAPVAESGKLPSSAHVPFGANFFALRSLYEQCRGYDEELWALCGASALGSEDAEFGMRIRNRGREIGYCCEAIVAHPVHWDRCKLKVRMAYGYHMGWRASLVEWEPAQPLMEFYKYRRLLVQTGEMAAHLVRCQWGEVQSDLAAIAVHVASILNRFSASYRKQARRYIRIANSRTTTGTGS